MQIPGWHARLFNLARAAESHTCYDKAKGQPAGYGLAITELSSQTPDAGLAIVAPVKAPHLWLRNRHRMAS